MVPGVSRGFPRSPVVSRGRRGWLGSVRGAGLRGDGCGTGFVHSDRTRTQKCRDPSLKSRPILTKAKDQRARRMLLRSFSRDILNELEGVRRARVSACQHIPRADIVDTGPIVGAESVAASQQDPLPRTDIDSAAPFEPSILQPARFVPAQDHLGSAQSALIHLFDLRYSTSTRMMAANDLGPALCLLPGAIHSPNVLLRPVTPLRHYRDKHRRGQHDPDDSGQPSAHPFSSAIEVLATQSTGSARR